MLSKVKCVAFRGLQVIEVDVEVSISSRGLPAFNIVGLPNKSVEESKHRIKSAFVNSGFDFPDCKITVNLAPADINKIGSSYDLPVAVGIFCAKNGIRTDDCSFFFGELSLDGLVRNVKGSYLVIDHIINKPKNSLFISSTSFRQASDCSQVYLVDKLSDIFDHLLGKNILTTAISSFAPVSAPVPYFGTSISDVVGQEFAKRALEISAAGGHNLMLSGTPGTGKSMLAKSILSILPDLASVEITQLRKIYSYVGKDLDHVNTRPFRSPHHTISYSGMIGGGAEPAPGEVTLSHNGVLFMDEFCEFSRNVLEALRQPMQDGEVSIVRNNTNYTFPSQFTLIAATNPCPCGYNGHPTKHCVCSEQKIASYTKKLSGPLSDRFDLFVSLYPEGIFASKSMNSTRVDETYDIKHRVSLARALQHTRLQKYDIGCNAFMTNSVLAKECVLNKDCKLLLDTAYSRFNFSPRTYFKLIKISRTIADLSASSEIKVEHLAEALQYRQR